MLPAFKASFEVANYSPSVEYLSEGGLYSGVFRKAFLYDKLASDGSNNTFICFEFLTRKEQKLAFHQSLGYKSQLKQQKEKYENKIKALKYDLEKKKQLSFKRKLSEKELLDLRKILAKDYDILCFKKWEYMLFAESVSGKNYKLEKENDFCIYKSIKDSFNSKLDYYKNYEEYEEKWRKILRK